jgi:hypothetical protein
MPLALPALRASLPALLLLAACSSPSGGAPVERAPGSAASPASGAPAGKAPAARAPVVLGPNPWNPEQMAAQRRACSAPCRGRFASLIAWRDAQGEVKRYESPGSPGDCSHPPLLFFNERGEETGAIPLVPVTPGSEEARKFDAIREQQTAGLRKADEVSCDTVRAP